MSDLRIEKLSMESTDITQENINKIKELFPQVVTEGKIDFDVLKTILGEQIENQNERYQFTWNGKSDTIRFAQKPSTGTLRPDKESSKNWDTTENLYIEGDNLEVLKLLQKTYHNKIKMIYIDPPYNTGGDFVYKDDFKDSIKNYKEQTNQTLRTNPETSGRYHTDWLNMMYSRLMLAKNLLTEDGVIFISIDDNEGQNLKKIGDEIFGEVNFIAQCVRKRRDSQANLSKNISPIHEYLMIYSRRNGDVFNKIPANINTSDYKNPDNDHRGPYVTMPCTNKGGAKYSVITPTGKEIFDEWRFKRETYDSLSNDNRLVFPKGGDGKPRYKIFLNEKIKEGKLANTWLDDVSSNQEASRELKSIFGEIIFDSPKPIELLKFCLQLSTSKNSLVLDFFSGSSTTAHAVMQLNAEDGGNRKFIMVQLPEKTDEKSEAFKAGYNNICEIGKERIRRAGEKIKSELIEKNQKAGMLEESIDPEKLDIGFKVYKLDSSNFNVFDSSSKDINNIFNHDVFLSDRSKLDIAIRYSL